MKNKIDLHQADLRIYEAANQRAPFGHDPKKPPYSIGQKVEVEILDLRDYGAKAKIISDSFNYQGLIHISCIANKFVERPADELYVGEIRTAYIRNIDDIGRIQLTLLEPDLTPVQTEDENNISSEIVLNEELEKPIEKPLDPSAFVERSSEEQKTDFHILLNHLRLKTGIFSLNSTEKLIHLFKEHGPVVTSMAASQAINQFEFDISWHLVNLIEEILKKTPSTPSTYIATDHAADQTNEKSRSIPLTKEELEHLAKEHGEVLLETDQHRYLQIRLPCVKTKEGYVIKSVIGPGMYMPAR